MINGNSIFNASMALFKKSLFLKISKNYTSYKFCGDWLFWIELARYGDVFICGKVLNYFLKHDQDVSGKIYLSGFNFVEELKVLYYVFDNEKLDKQTFFNSLFLKYIQYMKKRNTFSQLMKNDIDFLFLNDSRTITFKNQLKLYYNIHKFKNIIKTKIKNIYF